ncbi:MAG TPA: hypothetical protein VGF40_16100 [Thermoanaerobaculia bacterium]
MSRAAAAEDLSPVRGSLSFLATNVSRSRLTPMLREEVDKDP